MLLPPEVFTTDIHHQRIVGSRTVKVAYATCCSGGEIESCEASRETPFSLPQAVTVRKSRILGRCAVEPSDHPAPACKCN